MNKPQPIEMADSADLRGSWVALQRAAVRARELAAKTGTALVVIRHGSLEHLYPQTPQAAPHVQEAAVEYGKSV